MSDIIHEFAAAKINVALHVLGRRQDGYHELDSIVAFADYGDELTFTPSEQTHLTVTGPFGNDVPNTSDNLILKAYAALSQHAELKPAHVQLTKNLPVASGIGGGSADAAAALRGFMRISGIRFDSETMQKIALSLGADVPVCLHAKSCRMQGVGEVITPLEQLQYQHIVLVNPMQACSTAAIFKTMDLKPGDMTGTPLVIENPGEWRNDMTEAAIKTLPVIADVLNAIEATHHAKVVRMSGSGATCFALCETQEDSKVIVDYIQSRHHDWWTKAAKLF
jgi:4-diphosphocytidyl-2-C-methyl-D-erythritol kinase